MATAIAALRAGADWAEAAGEGRLVTSWWETADAWDARVEGWLYVRDTALARRLGIDGYYAHVLPSEAVELPSTGQGTRGSAG